MINALKRKQEFLFRTALAGFFILFFVSILEVKLWDYDFWWHISTGKHIVQNAEIPKEDVFSYSVIENRDPSSPTNPREAYLMGQYWLAQIFLYFIYEFLGSWGVAALRAILLTATLGLVFLGLRRNNVPPLSSLALVIPSFYALINKGTGERPVLFTFLLAVLVFLLIDDFLRTKGKSLYAVPPLMLLWANLHGGFFLGLVIIAVFVFSEVLAFGRKKSSLARDEFIRFVSLMTVSVLLTLLNPTGWQVLAMFQSKYSFFGDGVNEYLPFAYYSSLKVSPPLTSLFFIVIAAAITLLLTVFRIARMKLSHFIILAGILTQSLLHQRFMIFTATIGVIIIGAALTDTARRLIRRYPVLENYRLRDAVAAAVAIFVVFIAVRASLKIVEYRKAFSGDHVINEVQGPIDFIAENKVPGRMFNTDRVGGYAIWRLYPWKQVFYDTRGLNIAVNVEYKNILTVNAQDVFGKPLWEKLLDMYDVNIVVSHALDPLGNTMRLPEELNKNDNWALVYTDGANVVYVRNNDLNRELIEKTGLKNEDYYWSTIAHASWRALQMQNNPFLFKTIGKNFMKLEIWDEAEKAYRHALRIDPENFEATKALETIQEMLNRGGGDTEDGAGQLNSPIEGHAKL